MSGGIIVLTGLPATGKTSTLIDEMRAHQQAGGAVALFLSSEHEELTRRPNVKPGGLMGCRAPGLSFPIDYVCNTEEATGILADLAPNTLVVFDEAQFFNPNIVAAWDKAAKSGLCVLVGSPSFYQLEKLAEVKHEHRLMEVDCECKAAKATQVVYKNDMVYPTHLCQPCYEENMNSEISRLLEDVKTANPFPGELHTYQPFYGVDMSEWKLVRADSPQRLEIILDAVRRAAPVSRLLDDPVSQPTFLDLGCCSGFFSDGMADHGFRSSGVDVDKNFISWGNRLAKVKGQAINFVQSDAHKYLTESEDTFDVISTFATLQWVMAQKDYATGLECFKKVFEKARHVVVVEMGYTTEEIYKDKITDAPSVIDKNWVLALMKEHGNFASIEVHPAGENGIWRDVFVGFREVPAPSTFRRSFETPTVSHASNTMGYWEDSWVSPAFEVYFQALKPLTSVTLQAWRPDQDAAAPESVLTISLDGKEIAKVSNKGGLIDWQQSIAIEQNTTFRFSIDCSTTEHTPGDSRDLSYVLRELKFS